MLLLLRSSLFAFYDILVHLLVSLGVINMKNDSKVKQKKSLLYVILKKDTIFA